MIAEGHLSVGDIVVITAAEDRAYANGDVVMVSRVSGPALFAFMRDGEENLVWTREVSWPSPTTTDPAPAAEPEAVSHPQHYGGDTTYEAIKVIEAWGLGFHDGNAAKYLARAGKKDKSKEIEDIDKAIWYLQRHKANLEAAND